MPHKQLPLLEQLHLLTAGERLFHAAELMPPSLQNLSDDEKLQIGIDILEDELKTAAAEGKEFLDRGVRTQPVGQFLVQHFQDAGLIVQHFPSELEGHHLVRFAWPADSGEGVSESSVQIAPIEDSKETI